MKLKHLALSLALVVLAATSALAGKVTMHFFVVPASLPTTQINALNDYLVHTAGGFTASRSFGGALNSAGRDYAPDNLSYTVSAPKNLSKEIGAYIKTQLGQKDVFLVTWPADRLDD